MITRFDSVDDQAGDECRIDAERKSSEKENGISVKKYAFCIR